MLMLFIGLEILSISIYVLTGSDKRNIRSNEAALKYFLMGAFATGILLFGVALTYAATGNFSLQGIASGSVYGFGESLQLKSLGALLIIIGLLFKVSAAPFHFWTPDVYEGAPTVFTAFMATVVKTAGFAALYRILSISFGDLQPFWSLAIVISIVLTLIIGNLLAVVQTSFKRMLAYSSIAHAGYMLVGILAIGSNISAYAILYYSLAYGVATATAFGVLILVSEIKGSDNYDAFAGLGKSEPLLAGVLTLAMCSLAGIPITAGFVGKFYLFIAALDTDNLYILVPVVLASAISVYYYFRVITIMYMGERTSGAVLVGKGQLKFWLVLGSIVTVVLGTMPDVLKVFLVQ